MIRTRGAGVLIAATLLLVSCGGGDTTESGSESEETASEASTQESDESSLATPESFDPASAELPTGTFCDQVDAGQVAQALGMSPGDLKPLKNTAIGDEITPGPGIPPMPATANSCEYGKESGFLIGISPGFPEATNKSMVAESLERATKDDKPGKNTVMYTDCEAEKTTVIGVDGLLETCETVGASDPRVTARVAGMAANAKITCLVAQGGKQADPERLGAAVAELCPQLMQELAAG